VGDRGIGAAVLVARIADAYEAFLQDVQRPEDTLLEEFSSDEVRSRKLDEAAGYGKLVYDLLLAVVPAERMRYLVV
jgi:hypothetical protein